MSHFAELFAGGVPVLPGMGGKGLVAFRKVYFIDTNTVTPGDGLSIDGPFKLIQSALDAVVDQDTIVVMNGSYDEALTTGLVIGTSDVVPGRGRYCSLVGASVTPWAYDSPQLYNVSGSTATLSMRSPGWRVSGFRIVGDSGSPICISNPMPQAGQTAGTAWAPGTTFDNIVFYGAVGNCVGLASNSAGDVRVLGCVFELFGTASKPGIGNPDGGGFTTPGHWHIESCDFIENIENIDMSFSRAVIKNNVFGPRTSSTKIIDLRSGNFNSVHGNYLPGTYSNGGGYWQGNASDDWSGNFNMGVTNGITQANPA